MKSFVFTGILIATLILGASHAVAGQWSSALVTMGMGILWLVGEWRRWGIITGLGLVALMGMAAWGIWLDAPVMLLLAGTVAALTSWDLARFSRRLRQTDFVDGGTSLQNAHLQRLSIVAGVGLLLGSAALGLQINLIFGWAVLLALLMVVSLSVAVTLLRRSSG